MSARDPREPGRASSSLELLFDLIFVTAVASAGTQLQQGVVAGHWSALGGFAMTFFAIWWAWLNYTWFASAYDNDDVGFRVLTFVIMGGALILAAGTPELFASGQSPIVVAGYAVMRFGMALLWLRAAKGDPDRRRVALTYAGGISLVQLLWILRLALPEGAFVATTFVALVVAELAVPVVAERREHTPFHPGHLVDRAGGMAMIVLGEVVLATVVAIQTVLAGGFGGSGVTLELVLLVSGVFLSVVAIWWLYFRRELTDLAGHQSRVWAFGYLHYLVYASIAAVGAGVTAGVEVATHDAHVSAGAVEWLVGGAAAVFVLTVGVLHRLGGDSTRRCLLPAAVVAVLVLVIAAVGPSVGVGVLLTGLVLVAAVVVNQVWDRAASPSLPGD